MVIDLNSRRKQQAEQSFEATRHSLAEAAEKYANGCHDRVWAEAQKMRAIKGLDAALRMLGKIADDLRNQGKE